MAKNDVMIIIENAGQLRAKMKYCWQVVSTIIQGGPLEILIRMPSKSRIMEKKYHAMIRDVVKSVKPGGVEYSAEAWKRLLVDQFEMELNSQGEKLSHPSRTVISLDGKRAITLSPSTTQFRKAEAGDFIAFLYAFGAEHKVPWSEPALRVFEEYNVR